MTRRATRRQFLCTSALVGTAAVAPIATRGWAAPRRNDWIELFDGKSLDGWHINPRRIGHGTGGQWAVEEGVIAGQQDPPGSGNGGILLTDRKFKDFELLIDMKPDWGVCSGLFLRGNDRGQCFQMMVDYHNSGNVGHLYGEGTGGFNTRTFDINAKTLGDNRRPTELTTANHKTLDEAGLKYSCSPADWLKAWKLGDWNTARVRVVGEFPTITTWINDLKVCEFDGANSKRQGYNKDQVRQRLGAAGSIAVQVHGGGGWPNGAKCRWRKILIREL